MTNHQIFPFGKITIKMMAISWVFWGLGSQKGSHACKLVEQKTPNKIERLNLGPWADRPKKMECYGAPINGRKYMGFAMFCWGYFTLLCGASYNSSYNCFFGPPCNMVSLWCIYFSVVVRLNLHLWGFQDFYSLSLEQTLRSTGKIEHIFAKCEGNGNTGQTIG